MSESIISNLVYITFYLGCFPTQSTSALTLWVAPLKIVLHLRMFLGPCFSGDFFVIYVQIYDI